METGKQNPGGGDTDGTAEPSLTQKNSETVRGEEALSESGTFEHNAKGAKPAAELGATPSSYGASRGMSREERGPGEQVAGGGSPSSEE